MFTRGGPFSGPETALLSLAKPASPLTRGPAFLDAQRLVGYRKGDL
jgi:hypothetical protein